jgi:hypothetical protein
MRGEGRSCEVSANEYSCTQEPNKLWRSNSIFNLCHQQLNANISRTPATVPAAISGRPATVRSQRQHRAASYNRDASNKEPEMLRKLATARDDNSKKRRQRKRWLLLLSGTPATKGWSADGRDTHNNRKSRDASDSKNIGNSRVDSNRDTISSRDASKAIITYHHRIYYIAIFLRYMYFSLLSEVF